MPLFYLNSVVICRIAPHLPFTKILCITPLPPPVHVLSSFSEAACLHCYTSFSDELADRSTSWASKNSETDSDMESRLSLEACWVRGIPICSSACRQTHANTEDDSVYESVIIQNWPDPKTWSNSGFDFAAHVTFPEGKLLFLISSFFPIDSSLHRRLICWAYLPQHTGKTINT